VEFANVAKVVTQNRIKQTSLSTVNNTLFLSDDETLGFRRFRDVMSVGDRCRPMVVNSDGVWQLAWYTYTALNTLTYYELVDSSTGERVSFGPGNKILTVGPTVEDQFFRTRSTTYTAISGDRVAADTSGGSWTLTLPASPAEGDVVWIEDPNGGWLTNKLTVARTGNNIDGEAEDLEFTASYRVCLIYQDGQWLTKEFTPLFPFLVP
jgi:hypothetical protein